MYPNGLALIPGTLTKRTPICRKSHVHHGSNEFHLAGVDLFPALLDRGRVVVRDTMRM